ATSGWRRHKPSSSVSADFTAMAMIRVLGDYLRSARGQRTFEAAERQRAFENLIDPWLKMVPEFREEGFYERFAARGQVERISVIQRALANAIGVGSRTTVERN